MESQFPRYVAFDTETLGLEVRAPEQMLQLSMVYEDSDPVTGTTNKPVDQLPCLTLIIDPGPFLQNAEIVAVLMNTWVFHEIQKARKGLATKYPVVKLADVPRMVKSWMAARPARPFMTGQNVGTFDAHFLPKELHSLFHYRMMEIGSAFYDPKKGPLGLGEAKGAAGFSKNVAHDAYCEAMDYVLLLRTRHGGDLTPYKKD